jgi:hypothetical protein
MRATFMNSGMVLSIGLFFSLMIAGLASSLPGTMERGLTANGVPAATASHLAHIPPVGSLFAAFLGYNPMHTLLGDQVLASLPPDKAAYITGKTFFPQLLSSPFKHGLAIVFTASLLMFLVAAAASWMRGSHYVYDEDGDVGAFAAPPGPDPDSAESPQPEEWVPA